MREGREGVRERGRGGGSKGGREGVREGSEGRKGGRIVVIPASFFPPKRPPLAKASDQ